MVSSMRIHICHITTAAALILSALPSAVSAQVAQTREAVAKAAITNPVPRQPGLGHSARLETSAPAAPSAPRGGVVAATSINGATFHALPAGMVLARSALAMSDGSNGDKPPVEGPLFTYEGSYRVTGQGADGSKYTGTGTITRLGGNMYSHRVTIGSNVFEGVNIVDRGGALSFGWAAKLKDANVIVYDVLGNGTWDGVWFQSGDSTLGREIATPVGTTGALRHLVGHYPGGAPYGGTMKVTRLGNLSTEEFVTDALTWTINGGPSQGLALSIGSLVAAGFADTGKEFGVVLLVPHVKRDGFTGPWVQSIHGTISVGTETWTKQR